MSGVTLPDKAARTIALTNIDRSFLVEAGAGSGKTSIMAGRVSVLLARGKAPKNIAAITFTEFAASELRIRIDRFVNELCAGTIPPDLESAFPKEVPADQRANLAQAKKALDQLVCATIHGFAQALVKPYPNQLTEDYYIVHLREASGTGGGPATAAELLALHGGEIAQIVRGETTVLSEAERQEVLQSSISYYPTDLLVPGWTAAVIYDTEEGAAPTIQLLEYANTQLLEFRHYDAVLTQVLKGVYRSLDKGGGFLSRWKLAREAERLNAFRLEVTELTERIDNAIKFLSDMFYARLYRLAATKVGVSDYRNLVDEKLRTAGDLYQFMVEKFHQARGFVLELGVVIILIIELIFLFKGKPM
jgi:hypothetical protein